MGSILIVERVEIIEGKASTYYVCNKIRLHKAFQLSHCQSHIKDLTHKKYLKLTVVS